MPKNIEPSLKTIGQYLKLEEPVRFVIPEYQRAYSWTIEQCDKLWQDIIGYIDTEAKDNYFFGTIIVSCEDDGDNRDAKLCLIDGQQRTTTFLLLLKALLMRVNKAMETADKVEESADLYNGLLHSRVDIMERLYRIGPARISLKFDSEADAKICARDDILENNSINENYKNDLKVILSAIDYDEDDEDDENSLQVTRIRGKHGDNKFTNFFRNFRFFFERAKEELSETEVFKVARTVLDKCEIIEVKSWQVDQAITMFNSLNSDGLPLEDADIIAAKLYAKADELGVTDNFKELDRELHSTIDKLEQAGIASRDAILLQQMYCERATEAGGMDVTTPGVRRYFTQINKALLDDPIDLTKRMLNLANHWLSVSSNPTAKVLLRFNNNAKLFLAIYLSRFGSGEEPAEGDLNVILLSLLRLFAILEVVDIGYSSKPFKSFLFEESSKLADKSVLVSEIGKDFQNHIESVWARKDIRKDIEGRIADCERQSFVFLNEMLFAKESERPFDIIAQCDIEHIMPGSGKNLQVIRTDAGIATQEEFEEIVNKLGNKILLEFNINRAIGNEWFRTKVLTKLEAKTGYIDSTYPIANALVDEYKEIADKPYWTKDDIKTATEKAAKRIADFIFG